VRQLRAPEYEQYHRDGRKNAKAPQQSVLHGLAASVWRHEANLDYATLAFLDTPDYAKGVAPVELRAGHARQQMVSHTESIDDAVRQRPTGN
jgi:hypothetical protein